MNILDKKTPLLSASYNSQKEIIKIPNEKGILRIKNYYAFNPDYDLENAFKNLADKARVATLFEKNLPRPADIKKSLDNVRNSFNEFIKNFEKLDCYTKDELLTIILNNIYSPADQIIKELPNILYELEKYFIKYTTVSDKGGRKKDIFKHFLIGNLLSIYTQGTGLRAKIISTAYNDIGYSGKAFEFLTECNQVLDLKLGTSHNIAKIAKNLIYQI